MNFDGDTEVDERKIEMRLVPIVVDNGLSHAMLKHSLGVVDM